MRIYQQRHLKSVGATSSGVNLLLPLHHNVESNIQYIVFISINKIVLITCMSISLPRHIMLWWKLSIWKVKKISWSDMGNYRDRRTTKHYHKASQFFKETNKIILPFSQNVLLTINSCLSSKYVDVDVGFQMTKITGSSTCWPVDMSRAIVRQISSLCLQSEAMCHVSFVSSLMPEFNQTILLQSSLI